MKAKLFFLIFLFTSQIGFSQTQKLLHGKVFKETIPLKGVEVINKTSKMSIRTNELGEFSILVNSKDSLLFFSKNYFFKRFKVSQENITANNFIVNMIPIVEELNEVIINVSSI